MSKLMLLCHELRQSDEISSVTDGMSSVIILNPATSSMKEKERLK